MEHKGTVRIETPRLILRRVTPSDAGAAFKNWMSDPRVTEFLTWPTYTSVDDTLDKIREWCEKYEKPDFYLWAIELRETGEPIGSISAVEIDEKLSMVQIGYCIGSAFWGRGIMTEAFSALIRFFTDEVGVLRVEARHDPQNPASGRVMQKCGLKYEGTLRRAIINNRGIVDVSVYGLLAEDIK